MSSGVKGGGGEPDGGGRKGREERTEARQGSHGEETAKGASRVEHSLICNNMQVVASQHNAHAGKCEKMQRMTSNCACLEPLPISSS